MEIFCWAGLLMRRQQQQQFVDAAAAAAVRWATHELVITKHVA
jgi:ABC-type enterochelin transport system permease subunit